MAPDVPAMARAQLKVPETGSWRHIDVCGISETSDGQLVPMGAFTRMICSPSRSMHPLLTALHQAWSAAGEQAHNTEPCGQRSVCGWHRDGTAVAQQWCIGGVLMVQ